MSSPVDYRWLSVKGGEVSEHRDHVMTGLGSWRCVVTQKHKWVIGFIDTSEILIDLENDPDEMRNLAGNPAYSTIQHELDQHMKRQSNEMLKE